MFCYNCLPTLEHLITAFAGQVFHFDLNAVHPIRGDDFVGLLICPVNVIGAEFLTDSFTNAPQARLVFYDPGLTEGDDRNICRGTLHGHHLVLSDYAEGYLLIASDCIDLVAHLRAVEGNHAIPIDMAYRYRIGIAVVAVGARLSFLPGNGA